MSSDTKILIAKDITKIFPDPYKENTNINIFAGATFNMSSSNLNFLVGPSGSGKTTLLRIILGIEKIDAGELFFNDLPIYKLKAKEKIAYLRTIGYMDQFPAKYLALHIPVKKNIAFSLAMHNHLSREERNKRILDFTTDFGIKDLLDKRTIHLSGGEMRRLGLICNTIFYPSILLLDEPTAQLDQENCDMVIKVITNFHDLSDDLILISTHDQSIINQNPKFLIEKYKVILQQ
ncbi:MAG TPA: ATP-binding cassette domain-containing protein [Candidatus Bathyarchaeia archaeon]|nr:ATP-binding cassette domain-containing protein [Candidatus Bathyarchaeia archaeon]